MAVNAKHLQELAVSLNNLAKALDQIAGSLGEQPASAPAPEKPGSEKKSVKAPAKKLAQKKKPTCREPNLKEPIAYKFSK